MKCDLDKLTTYLIRGHLSHAGLPQADVDSVSVRPCEGGSMEYIGAVYCLDMDGNEREVRKLADNDAVNALVNSQRELDCLGQDVRSIREPRP